MTIEAFCLAKLPNYLRIPYGEQAISLIYLPLHCTNIAKG